MTTEEAIAIFEKDHFQEQAEKVVRYLRDIADEVERETAGPGRCRSA